MKFEKKHWIIIAIVALVIIGGIFYWNTDGAKEKRARNKFRKYVAQMKEKGSADADLREDCKELGFVIIADKDAYYLHKIGSPEGDASIVLPKGESLPGI